MRPAHRGLAALQIVLVGFLLCGASTGPDADPRRCRTDALEKWYCAADPRGSAVVDDLGRIVCAPGACTKVEKDGWMCSTLPGGKAIATPTGPVCDGECRAPETTECKKV